MQLEIPQILAGKSKLTEIVKKLGIAREDCPFFQNPKNAGPFAVRKFLKCEPDFLVEWKGPQLS